MAQRPSEPRIVGRFLGWQNGWYTLRMITRGHDPQAVHAFTNTVLEWLIEQDITPNSLSYLANGNTGDGPVVPAMADGSALCLLLRRAPDVLRFERQFGCRGVTPEAMFTALQAEASVHHFVLADLALIAYDAVRRLALLYGDDDPEWDDLSEDEQQLFLQVVREYHDQPERPADALHAAWVDRRLSEGWRYAPDVDVRAKQHPYMVPFAKLSDHDQACVRLTVNVIVSLTPLLRRHA
jgi:hypothetical protein